MAGSVKLTNLDKVFWPEDGLTKGNLVEYYRAMATVMLPHLRGRPLTVKRFPTGIEGEAFFQKNAPKYTPDWIKTITLPADTARGEVRYILCNDRRTLLWLGNQASIELHTWLSTVDRLDRPDSLVLDIDPPDGRFDLAVGVAALTCEVLRTHGIDGCAKTSGAKGMHVYVPIRRSYTHEQVGGAAFAIAREVEGREPDLVTTEFRKVKRDGKVFLDATRLGRGQTMIAPYSPRARPGAPVSFPVRWTDLERVDPLEFTITTVPNLVKRADPWVDRCPQPQTLPKDLLGG